MRRGVFCDWLEFEATVTRVAGMMAAGLIHWYDSEPVKGETRSNQETLDLDTMSRMKMSQLVVVSVILNVRESVLVTL